MAGNTRNDGGKDPDDAAASAAGPAAAGAGQDQEYESVGREVKVVLLDVLPWGLAVLLHAAVIMLSIFLVFTGGKAPAGPSADDQVPANIAPPTRLASASQLDEVKPAQPQERPKPEGNGELGGLGQRPEPISPQQKHPPMIGVENMGPVPSVPVIVRPPDGKGTNIFQRPSGGDTGERGGVGGKPGGDGTGDGRPTGPGGAPKRFLFLIDASGSMIEGMPYVIDELSAFIRDMKVDEQFAVLFIHADKPLQVVGSQLRSVSALQPYSPGTPLYRDQAIAALALVRPEGSSDVRPALKAAFSDVFPPDVVYILSANITGAGQYEINRKVLLEALATYNPAEGKLARQTDGSGVRVGPALVYAIQFLQPDPLLKQNMARSSLDELVQENNARIAEYWHKVAPDVVPPAGTYRYLGSEEVFGSAQ